MVGGVGEGLSAIGLRRQTASRPAVLLMNIQLRDAAGAGEPALWNAAGTGKPGLGNAAAFGLDQVLQGMK